MLTAAAVKNLRPKRSRREVPDAHGLYLIIQPSGKKSWALRFRGPDGRNQKLTLGSCDETGQEIEGEPVIGGHLTLPAARRLASEVHRRRALGRDVIAEQRTERQHRVVEMKDAALNTFAACAREFIEREARGRKKNRGWRFTAQVLGLRYGADGGEPEVIRGGLADRWRNKKITEVTEDDVFLVIDEARERGVPGRRARVRGPSEARAREVSCALSAMFGWLRKKRRVASDPCAGVERPHASARRDRNLGAGEIRLVWAACARADKFGALVKVLLLTGQRRGEVAGMRRTELSEDMSTWTIPGARTKNKRDHVVPLPRLAREIIAEVASDDDELIFSTNGETAVSGFSKFKRRLDESALDLAREADPEAEIEPWRLHDLRRTAVTGMAEIGVEPHVIEAVVNHVSGHKASVAGIYNRAEYAEPKRRALERWADHVEALVSGREKDNVVPLAAKKRRKAR